MGINLKDVAIYTDGAAEPNPGPGGWGVVLLFGGHRKELSGGVRRTTNNRMELRAAIEGLKALRALCAVTVHCDSKYVVEAMTSGAARGWREKEFLRKGMLITNADLWEELLELCDLHRVRFVWVKGHAGEVENERCDALAMAALAREGLAEDGGYEAEAGDDRKAGVRGRAARGASDEVVDEERDRAWEEEFDAEARRPVSFLRAGKAEKITREGQACRKCGVAVERREPRKRGKGEFYFEWYLRCPGCGTMYMVEEAKRWR